MKTSKALVMIFVLSVILISTASSFSIFGNVKFYDEPALTTEEIFILTGEKWTGNLTYLDYQTNLETKIPADITVRRSEENDLDYILYLEFPKEPHANITDTVSLSEDGMIFDMKKVIEKSGYSGDSLMFITESTGIDDDKEALFRHTYVFNQKVFIIRKDVKYTDETDFIKRNEFYFTR